LTEKPVILAPREPLVDRSGQISRSWWRALNGLFEQSGTLAKALVTNPSAVLASVDVSSGGTISAPDLAAKSLIGNPADTTAQPVAIAVSDSFALNSGTLDLASLAAGTLSGNGGLFSAPPGAVRVGSNLTLANGTLDVSSTSDMTDQTYAYSIRDTRGPVNTADRAAADALTLALLGGSTSSPSAAPITVAADSLFGNAGTVAASGSSIAVGTGLTLSPAGTLSATGGGIYAPLVNGDLPSPGLIADPFGQCIMVQIR
jgi:hypothetical protein